jgi:hypothetical protein
MSIFAKVQANKAQTAAFYRRCSSFNLLSIFVVPLSIFIGMAARRPRSLGARHQRGNPGGRPKPPDVLRTRLAELSPRAVERLAELLDSADE